MTALARESSMTINSGNTSQSVAMSTTAASSTAIDADSLVIYVSADCFVRAGLNPTAVSTGVDQFLIGANQIRIEPWIAGNKLSLVMASGTGTAYITPGV